MMDKQNPSPNKDSWGIPFLIALFVLAGVLGVILFKNYVSSERVITASLVQVQQKSAQWTIEQCAEQNMRWYTNCKAMKQICDDTVSRMMKVCLTNGDKSAQCNAYGDEVKGYNFGATQCKPYFKNHDNKKACADTWQAIADYCKAVNKK